MTLRVASGIHIPFHLLTLALLCCAQCVFVFDLWHSQCKQSGWRVKHYDSRHRAEGENYSDRFKELSQALSQILHTHTHTHTNPANRVLMQVVKYLMQVKQWFHFMNHREKILIFFSLAIQKKKNDHKEKRIKHLCLLHPIYLQTRLLSFLLTSSSKMASPD